MLQVILCVVHALHARNDTHPGDSPYESYCARFTVDNFFVVNELEEGGYAPALFNSLDEYFKNLANYSNGYFFSKDTINDPKYDKPEIVEEKDGFGYGADKDGEYFELVRTNKRWDEESEKIITEYELKDNKDIYKPILHAYWTRLSRAAILHGAGVIDLFFREAEKARDDPTQLEVPPQTGSVILSFFGEFSRAKTILADAKNWVSDKTSGIKGAILGVLSSSGVPVGGGVAGLTSTPEPSEPSELEPTQGVDSMNEVEPQSTEQDFEPEPAIVDTVIDEEVVTEISISDVDIVDSMNEVEPHSEQPEEFEPFWKPMVPAPAGAGGGGGPTSVAPVVQIEPVYPVAPLEEDGTGESEPEPEPEPQDTIPPEAQFVVQECENSLSENSCLLATTTLNLFWWSDAGDLDFYELTLNGNSIATTATSTMFIAEDNSVNSFSIRAKDETGNWSDWQNISVEVSLNPVVINEVAWGGTSASPYDEWIELYNKTSEPINLSNWVLYSQTDMGPYINLSGVIPAKGYYLIERTDDGTISDISADLTSSFSSGLNNPGEILILSHASTTVDQNVLCGIGPCRWCPGFDYKYRSMERIDPFVSGTEHSNWGYNDGLLKNGKDADGAPLSATPKARNSQNYYIVARSNTLNFDKILTKENSPYFVNNSIFVVNKGVTLSIEPGVVIKFYNDAGMFVQGKIISTGTESEPIAFTSFYDDDYGGDLNGDATTTSPSPGAWFGISFSDSADSGSVLNHTIVRYGGKWYNGVGNHQANVEVRGVDVEISNSIFEYAVSYGLKLISSNSRVRNNIFRYNSASGGAAGILVEGGGGPVIESNNFIENRWALMIRDSQPSVLSNNFVDNFRDAINVNGALGIFRDNIGSGNGVNAIKLTGNLTKKGMDITMYPNSLPYVIDSGSAILASSTLFVKTEVVLKGGYSLAVFGNLIAEGETPGDILFTSTGDDLTGSSTPSYWAGIRAMPGSNVSLKGVTVRYGSVFAPGSTTAGLYAEGAEVSIINSIFENGRAYGAYFRNSTSTIENSIFRNHMEYLGAVAISYYNSPINLKDVIFSNNRVAVYADPSSIVQTAENLIFENNTSTTSPEELF